MLAQRIIRRSRVFCSLHVSYTKRSKGTQSNSVDSPLRQLLNDSSGFAEATTLEPELQWATQPYAARAPGQAETSPRVDPQETSVLLFPGQGSQKVGMGRELLKFPAAKDLYDLASSVVGWDVRKVCVEGPAEELDRRCQTAVLVTSLAALERARDERPAALQRVRAVAGFSLGEITALVFAGSLTFEGALRLVELRAAAMRAAARERAGGMLTLWLAPDARLPLLLLRARERAAERGVPAPVAVVANYLFPGCKVVAGDEEALKFIERNGSEFGVKRAARVRVEGAFHTPLMARAEEAVRAALGALEVCAPRVRVVSGVEARALGDAGAARRALARHVTRPVRWEQTLQALYARPRGARFPLTLALGPGGALRSTLRQVNARAWDRSLQIDA
ncbi:probable malonyl-CoA-acyl carrier protein transacylase, mitochondrial [Ostrinia furnacalis]|uniref:probable malonyl-CoA-acyl carrier protein transacylase, mitochondrial n=1 Tax=Ostrinia furnacalis TaxID=93504 RepID=UPI00103E7963|nr:probable malonyl-CoA-acyl carrier protein transacylase, mitochondrial [Ostrinia furnacalis]